MNLSAYPHTVCLTKHVYMARSGRLRRPGRGLKSDNQSKPKTNPDTPLQAHRFRLIVDD